jgi:hypothetical protein
MPDMGVAVNVLDRQRHKEPRLQLVGRVQCCDLEQLDRRLAGCMGDLFKVLVGLGEQKLGGHRKPSRTIAQFTGASCRRWGGGARGRGGGAGGAGAALFAVALSC